ncbi:hypothetical protein F3Y22_tig00110730pilonHSYRG00062 [Hibiscus syriacus]|uniref:DNA repair metallo-beta-lactamase domain-containing protein n=1 Tax=Hibiscus syriacus TaxID=106335 RepID=A0A6A2ZTH4_HIBSY|nr:hypothetical protein F3Y22_tig00110730pilonHSYRG00062 [Hibiscus syriacus]
MVDACEVVLIDANHCTGAVQFLFKVPTKNGSSERIGKEFKGKRVLFLVATYVVGKEKILVEVARRCKRKIFVDGRKMEILNVLGYGEEVFTVDESESDVHVVGYEKVVGFVPTGWTYEIKQNKFSVISNDSVEIHLVPYSEHSNYDELREYVKFLKPKKVIPTVGMDIEKLDSKHADKLRKHFAGLVDEMANKKDFLMGFHCGNCESVENVKMDASPVLENVEIGGRIGPEIEECPKGESTLSTDLSKSYLEKIDQFIQIINGNESSRDYVVTLLEKAQGDINKALDIYYSNPEVKHDENT